MVLDGVGTSKSTERSQEEGVSKISSLSWYGQQVEIAFKTKILSYSLNLLNGVLSLFQEPHFSFVIVDVSQSSKRCELFPFGPCAPTNEDTRERGINRRTKSIKWQRRYSLIPLPERY